MARALDWTKDRNRQLSKRAAAENIEDLRQLHSVQWPGSYIAKENKAANRAFAADIAQYHQITQANQDPRGSWKISCEGCAAVFDAQLALSTALETLVCCPECEHGHWLCERDLEIPWD
jgi:hypothetical protein